MLMELKVSNFAIIENLHIQFKNGLNILSGETGAGKSVLLKSLGLLMGQKGSTESIRSGSTQASIEGSFDISKRADIQKKLEEMGIDCEEKTLVVRRVLSEEKSRVYLNGTLSTLQGLRDMVCPLIEVAGHSAPLIEMTGQHENRHLLSKAYHMDLLDQYIGSWNLRSKLNEKYMRLSKIRQEIKNFETEAQSKAQRLDFLIFQRNEIEKLGLGDIQNLDIEVEVKKLKSSAKISKFVDAAEAVLYSDDDSACSRIYALMQKSHEVTSIDPVLKEKMQQLDQAKSLIEDCVYELKSYVSKIDADPSRLEELESKLSDLRKVQKKYGADIADIFTAFDKINTEISNLENSDMHIETLKNEAQALEKELRKMALELHDKRVQGAATLEKSVNHELLDLNMKGVTFHVAIEKLEQVNANGISDIEFTSRATNKEPQRPLAKFASGGELSRILLSLKRVVGSSNQPRTYLFDEVDTGVSGPTAEKVGRKLKAIAEGQQVICVTHLPQVAAFGDTHFYIQKSPADTGKKTATAVSMEIKDLQKKERVYEIARLISGETISKTSLAHAEQLLKESMSSH